MIGYPLPAFFSRKSEVVPAEQEFLSAKASNYP